MKRKVYIALSLSFFMIIIGLFFITTSIMGEIKNSFSKKYYLNIIERYKTIKGEESIFLESIAKYLANSNMTLKAYLTNNKKYLINAYMPLYKSLDHNHLINEMNFFKVPVKKFLGFDDVNFPEVNLIKIRQDVLWIDTYLKPDIYFFVCKKYPGLRAAYPIIYHNKLYGSVVVGVDILFFKKIFDKLNMPTTLYLNDKLLKQSLKYKKYEFYKKFPLYKGYRIVGRNYKIDFSNKYEIKDSYVYIIIPIKDLFKRNIGYIVIKRNFVDVLNIARNNIFTVVVFSIIVFVGIFSIVFVLFKYIYKRFTKLEQILNLIKNREFENLPKKVIEKDEFDKFKNNLIDVAEDLSVYINLLSNERKYFLEKAYVDELTSIYNRNFLEEKAEEITEKFKLTKEPLGVIMFDIDDFKKINDTYGHDIGDLALSELALNIKKLLRKEDMFIRYGGEEFLILFPHTFFKDVIKIAQKIRKTVEVLKIKTPEKTLHITISVGVSEFFKDDETIFDAIKRADKKLYEAKRSGKNRVIY